MDNPSAGIFYRRRKHPILRWNSTETEGIKLKLIQSISADFLIRSITTNQVKE